MKMETPKMDVVRFKEADVLAASGDVVTKLALANLNDAATGNVTIDGTSVDTYEKLKEKLGGKSDSYFQWKTNTPVHETNLLASENSGALFDGVYELFGTYNDGDHGEGPLWYHQ